MFELGNSLRETRLRRGLELAQVAAETCIRTRYLEALEEERFERLPGSVYAMGFLRSYADYLGLDSQLFLDEYDARFRTEEEVLPVPAQLELRPRSLRRYGLAAIVLLLALGGAILAWQLSSTSSPRPPAGGRSRPGASPRHSAAASAPCRPRGNRGRRAARSSGDARTLLALGPGLGRAGSAPLRGHARAERVPSLRRAAALAAHRRPLEPGRTPGRAAALTAARRCERARDPQRDSHAHTGIAQAQIACARWRRSATLRGSRRRPSSRASPSACSYSSRWIPRAISAKRPSCPTLPETWYWAIRFT
jgi:transcriptional regulator with XRE-family HTH domain